MATGRLGIQDCAATTNYSVYTVQRPNVLEFTVDLADPKLPLVHNVRVQ